MLLSLWHGINARMGIGRVYYPFGPFVVILPATEEQSRETIRLPADETFLQTLLACRKKTS